MFISTLMNKAAEKSNSGVLVVHMFSYLGQPCAEIIGVHCATTSKSMTYLNYCMNDCVLFNMMVRLVHGC